MKKAKVFLSYAREDWGDVEPIYAFLRAEGLDVWVDQVNLVPGQNWEAEIRHAIEASHVFIACLSKRSVNAEGYVQKELRLASSPSVWTTARCPTDSTHSKPVTFGDPKECSSSFRQLRLPQSKGELAGLRLSVSAQHTMQVSILPGSLSQSSRKRRLLKRPNEALWAS